MSKKYTPEEMSALLKEAEAQEAKRKAEQEKAVVDHFDSGLLPTPEPIARILAWKIGEDRLTLIRHHPYWKEYKLKKGFDAAISAALAAHLDLKRCEAALTAYAARKEGFSEHINQTVEDPAQKEIMAFCAAYAATVDTLRRIKNDRSELADQIDGIRKNLTSDPEYNFMLDLRRNLSHGSVTVPNWNVRSNFETTVGIMKFSANELLAFGEWNATSKVFLNNAENGEISISEVTEKCASGLAKLRRELRTLYYRNKTPAEIDFFDIEDMAGKMSSRQFLKVFLQPHFNKKTDPYPYLHLFFSGKTLRQIFRFPPHSKEQVDFMIGQKLHETDCDDDLRSKLYKLFGVNEEMEAEKQKPSLGAPPLVKGWQTYDNEKSST